MADAITGMVGPVFFVGGSFICSLLATAFFQAMDSYQPNHTSIQKLPYNDTDVFYGNAVAEDLISPLLRTSHDHKQIKIGSVEHDINMIKCEKISLNILRRSTDINCVSAFAKLDEGKVEFSISPHFWGFLQSKVLEPISNKVPSVFLFISFRFSVLARGMHH